MSQILLLPDPRPLDEQLGREFFRSVPKCAGVYLMRDAADRVLYIGKAKNLQQRLRHYRTANPDRMPRRHLRLVRETRRIELQFCDGETAALRREAKLLRTLRPKFNRAGVWPGKTRFITWRVTDENLELAVVEVPPYGWRRYGPLGRAAVYVHQALVRILWLAAHPARGMGELPHGWSQRRMGGCVRLRCSFAGELLTAIDALFWQPTENFTGWLTEQVASRQHPFERAVIAEDLEALQTFSKKQQSADKQQLALL